MRKTLAVSTFIFLSACLFIASATLVMVQQARLNPVSASFLPESANSVIQNYDSYQAVPPQMPQTSVEIVPADARADLVDNFFIKYKSPMIGLGAIIVDAADKYSLPFGLLPAIAQCEGNVGKVMPKNSFNTWGWAIYGDKVMHFTSWSDGVEKVSSGLRKNYFNKGLVTPNEIMKKYTPSSNGSWADCVSQFLEELR